MNSLFYLKKKIKIGEGEKVMSDGLNTIIGVIVKIKYGFCLFLG